MAEPTVPEEVYRAAAAAYHQERHAAGLVRQEWVDSLATADDPPLRAAVEAAYRRGQTRGSDIVDAAIAYVTEPDGSDQIEHYWYQLKDAVGTYLKADADG